MSVTTFVRVFGRFRGTAVPLLTVAVVIAATASMALLAPPARAVGVVGQLPGDTVIAPADYDQTATAPGVLANGRDLPPSCPGDAASAYQCQLEAYTTKVTVQNSTVTAGTVDFTLLPDEAGKSHEQFVQLTPNTPVRTDYSRGSFAVVDHADFFGYVWQPAITNGNATSGPSAMDCTVGVVCHLTLTLPSTQDGRAAIRWVVVDYNSTDASGTAGNFEKLYLPVSAPTTTRRPTAAFTATASSTSDPGQYQFVSSSTDPSGDALTLTWDFGDGTTGLGPAVTHSFTTPGAFTVRLTATDPAGATDQVSHQVLVQPPALTATLSFVDAHGGVLSDPQPRVGDLVYVQLTVSASSDGVGALSDVGFGGAPLKVTPSTGATIAAPSPVLPSSQTLRPGEQRSYVFPATVTALGPIRFTTPVSKAVDAGGAAVTGTAGQASLGVPALTVTLSLDKTSFVQPETTAGPQPTKVTLTEKIVNTSATDLTGVTLRSLDAGPARVGDLVDIAQDSGPTPDPSSGYALGDLPAGASITLSAGYTVRDDGNIEFSSLVTAASGLNTVRGYGSVALTVRPKYYLEFRSHVVEPSSGLLPAGQPIVISGLVHNLTDTATEDLGPLFATSVAGNAGLQGLAYGGAKTDPRSLKSPPPLILKPGDTERFTLEVLTAYSDPTGTGGVRRSGGTSATVGFAPWADVHFDDGTTVQTSGLDVLTGPADLTHRISIDDSVPIPQTSTTAIAAGLISGAAEGVWNAASGIVTGLISLPSVAASTLLAVTQYQQRVWDSFTESQKRQFSDHVASLVVPVLEANVKAAAEGVPKLYAEASQFVYQYFTKLENTARIGNVADVVHTYASLITNGVAQAAIPAALGYLAKDAVAVDSIETVQAKLQAKLTPIVARIGGDETMGNVLRTLDRLTAGDELNAQEIADLYGISPEELRTLQQLATKYKVLMVVRSRAASSIDWIERFDAVVKPETLKIKSVSALDEQLGYPAHSAGSLVFKKPTPLIEWEKSGGLISSYVQSFVEGKGFTPGTSEYYNAVNRVAERIGEWNKYAETYRSWSERGWIETSFNWTGNKMSDPVGGSVANGKFEGFRLQPLAEPDTYRVQMLNGKVGRYVPVTGDIDPIAFTHLDGSPLTPEEHAELLNAMRNNPLLNTRHGESATYVNGGLDFISSQFKPDEPGLQLAPGGAPPRVVRFNQNLSVWNSATDYHLVWDGGYVDTGSQPGADAALDIDYRALEQPPAKARPQPALPVPGNGASDGPNVGRCSMVYSTTPTALPLQMSPAGGLVEVTGAGVRPSPLQSSCFHPGPVLTVDVKPSTVLLRAISAGQTEIPVRTGSGAAGHNDKTGFAVGAQVSIGAGTDHAETGTISAFGSIILAAPLRYAHSGGEIIVEIPRPSAGPALAATGATVAAPVELAVLLVFVGVCLSAFGRPRRRARR